MSKAKTKSRRDFKAEALEQVSELVAAFPNRPIKALFDLACDRCPSIREWVEGIGIQAQLREFNALLRANQAMTKDGRSVRGILSHTKVVIDDEGNAEEQRQWKLFAEMDRDEAWDACRDLRKNIRGCISQHDAQVDYWSELHPDYEPLPHYDECNGDDEHDDDGVIA